MDIGVEIMKKRNKKLTELLEQRRALCDRMTHGVPGCSTDCKAHIAAGNGCPGCPFDKPTSDNGDGECRLGVPEDWDF